MATHPASIPTLAAALALWLCPGMSQARQPLYSAVQVNQIGDNFQKFQPDLWTGQVNSRGEVVGWFGTAPFDSEPAIWRNGEVRLLGTFGGGHGVATAINDLGQVTGVAAAKNSQAHSFLWDPRTGLLDLGIEETFGVYSRANAINNLGQVAGGAFLGNTGRFHAYSWSGDDGLVPIDDGRYIYSEASDSNDAGMIVGSAQHFDPDRRHVGFVWSPTEGLRQVPGEMSEAAGQGSVARVSAFAINNNNRVVGNFGSRAFVWDVDGEFRLIQPQGHGTAYDVNDAGVIVGRFAEPRQERIAYVTFDAGETLLDLNSLLSNSIPHPLTEATSISEAGHILANDGARWFLLTPVPAPSSIVILAVGSVLATRRRRKPECKFGLSVR